MTRRFSSLLVFLFAVLSITVAGRAFAAPEAHILRIDPRAGMVNGKPTLTTVVEVVQFKRLSDVLQPCAAATGAATLSCWSNELEKPRALWDPFPFPEANAHLLVSIGGEDSPTKFVDKTPWGKAQNQPNVGTAWLVSVDASSGMGGRFGDARAIAHEIIESMGPNDLMDLMFFDDVQVVHDTKWKTYKQRADLANALNTIKSPYPSHGSNRALFTQIKNMTQDAFGSLGNSDAPEQVPLHQAMVVLSNGAGRGDPESASPSADVFHQYLNGGRFPADNTSLPKTPLPVISIWLPNPSSFTENIYQNNEAQFMQALANPEIGGFFDVVREHEGEAKGKTIINLVRARFNAMWLIHWELSCINPSVTQTFNLVFENTKPIIAPDGTFKNVPLGIDPTQWPLNIDMARTIEAAAANPIYPGGPVTVYGDFCWAGDKSRAEAYFVPAGTRPPAQAKGHSLAAAKQAMQQLQAENMVGTPVQAADGYVTFTVPDDPKVLDGQGDNMVARLVVYDNKAHRASGTDSKTVITLKATKKPLSAVLIGGVAGLAIVVVLLVIVLVRGSGGGGRKGRGGGGGPSPAPPPGYGTPQRAGGYGGQPPAGGYTPPGGGYGMIGDSAQPPPQASPMPPPPVPVGASPVVQVRCPACAMTTMATPGQPSVCFSCGQPLPAEIVKGGGGVAAPGFPLTGALNASPLVPPPNPYDPRPAGADPHVAQAPNGAQAASIAASLRGAAGQFTIRSGSEVRVGRDPSQCPIVLAEPRVSGVHATVKVEAGRLLVRDEMSNNGTWVAGSRIAPGTWMPVGAGIPLRFGPVEFSVTLEG